MKCVTKEDGYDILQEIHEGVCGNHAASRTLVGKAYRAGFWWPTAVTDAEDLVRRCQKCQFFGKQTHVPTHSLITIPPSWPFACWCLNMIGPFTTAPGGFTHVLVAIDKFTKWIKYKPIAKLTLDRVVDFISDILHRFGFPNTIITDLGSSFTANQFWEFCENACIAVKYVSVAHPRANGQVERANGLIIDSLKKRLYDENSKKGGKWVHELSHVVWGLRTQPSKATGQTLFLLVYGSEAILPADIMWRSPRVEMYNEGEADEARQLELDSVEEARCTALVQLARYLQGIRRYHDRNVRERHSMLVNWSCVVFKTNLAYTS
jgi:transposase InsO family protein